MTIEITADDVEALSHLHACGPLISGLRCELCMRAQTFIAQARALVDPLPTAPGSQMPLEPGAQAALRARVASRKSQ